MLRFAPNIHVFAYINPEDDDPSPLQSIKGREDENDPLALFKARWGEHLIKLKQYTKSDVETPANTCEDRFPFNGTRLYSQWMTWKGCYDMVTDEENSRHTKYDVIVKVRPDTQLKGRLPFSAQDVMNSQPAVWGLTKKSHAGLNDYFFVTHRDTADAVFGTHLTYWKCWDREKMDNILKTYGWNAGDAGEQYLMTHLKESGVPVQHVWKLKEVMTVVRDCHGPAVELGNGVQACLT